MGSRLVEMDEFVSQGHRKLVSKDPSATFHWFQFVPAYVESVITGPGSLGYDSNMDLNCVFAKPHYPDPLIDPTNSTEDSSMTTSTKYWPLLRGMVDTPVKGDQVLVCTFGGKHYYMGPVNTINSPNWTPDHLYSVGRNLTNKDRKKITGEDLVGISKNYDPISQCRLSKLYNQKLDGDKKYIRNIHGDMLFEGRYGNSIRLGSRDVNPCLFISNGRGQKNSEEGISDNSLISFTDKGSLQDHFGSYYDGEKQEKISGFILSSDTVKDNKRLIGDGLYNYTYEEAQLLENADKITINSKKDGIFLSSLKNTVIGTGGSFVVKSNNHIMLDAGNIYLGKKYDDSTDYEMDNLVLGQKLNEVLEGLIGLFESATALVQGVPVALSDITGAPLKPAIQELKTLINSDSHLSKYHFIEHNENKQ